MTADQQPQVVDVVILDADEIHIAAVSVRMYLANLRSTYRRNVDRGLEFYAERCVEKFDNALDLYERLGGDPAQVLDITGEAGPR